MKPPSEWKCGPAQCTLTPRTTRARPWSRREEEAAEVEVAAEVEAEAEAAVVVEEEEVDHLA